MCAEISLSFITISIVYVLRKKTMHGYNLQVLDFKTNLMHYIHLFYRLYLKDAFDKRGNQSQVYKGHRQYLLHFRRRNAQNKTLTE